MKALLPICVIALLTLPLAGDTPTPAAPRTLGRFRLFHGQYEQVGASSTSTHNGVFKIDSATGRTWIYHIIAGSKASDVMEGFFEVRNYDRKQQTAEDFLSDTNTPKSK